MARYCEDDYEKCCLCHKKLEISKDRPVWDRAFYVEGAGQLCGICYRELYGSPLSRHWPEKESWTKMDDRRFGIFL